MKAESINPVTEAWIRRKRRLYRLLVPPRPLVENPAERLAESKCPLGRWNLYIGGAGSSVEGWVNVDIIPLPGLDVVCNAERLPFPRDRFTRVECDAVLEHAARPEMVLSEIHRCLEPGGTAHLVVPFCHPFHPFPNDYRRFTPEGLRLLLGPFSVLAEGWRTGPTATLLVFLLEYCKLWMPSKRLRQIAHFLLGWLLFPLRYLDLILFRIGRVGNIGNHFYFYIQKPPSAAVGPPNRKLPNDADPA